MMPLKSRINLSTMTSIGCYLLVLLLINLSLIHSTLSTSSSDEKNWTSNLIDPSKSSSDSNTLSQDKLDRIYQYVWKRFNDDPMKKLIFEADQPDEALFNRQERHLRFGKRFDPRTKYSDLDYGHMRFGK
ncbi:hypothetical protein SSS_03312 [Sarcoptes scabiei]|uniref:Uncharacterized protein n=1 Tax=Sarcoptes scabiei TaxID=52283 RepID=A0A834VA24_SARSC|nr:hypothetical protein SSS_03312 [Sarcoptes scabiei]